MAGREEVAPAGPCCSAAPPCRVGHGPVMGYALSTTCPNTSRTQHDQPLETALAMGNGRCAAHRGAAWCWPACLHRGFPTRDALVMGGRYVLEDVSDLFSHLAQRTGFSVGVKNKTKAAPQGSERNLDGVRVGVRVAAALGPNPQAPRRGLCTSPDSTSILIIIDAPSPPQPPPSPNQPGRSCFTCSST